MEVVKRNEWTAHLRGEAARNRWVPERSFAWRWRSAADLVVRTARVAHTSLQMVVLGGRGIVLKRSVSAVLGTSPGMKVSVPAVAV